MQMDVNLDQEEVKRAIKIYLKEEKGIAASLDDMSFNIKRSSAQPGQIGSPKVKSVTCENVNKLET